MPEIPESEVQFRTSRSGGPGGQHANKTETRVEAVWSVVDSEAISDEQRARLREKLASRITQAGELIVACESERSQTRNKELALERLRGLVIEALRRPRPRKRRGVPRAVKKKRVDAKKRRGKVKQLRRRPQTE